LSRLEFGARGEQIAAQFLTSRGHVVLARRFRNRHGELDLVTRSGEHLYFVEVKARSSRAFGGAFAAVTPVRKQRRMARVAARFIVERDLHGLVPHFAVIALEPAPGGASLRFLPDAFDAAC
jgi:putative endonuclease